MMKAPCLGCTDRSITCHETCEKYIKFSNERAEFRKAKAKLYDQNVAVYSRKNKAIINKLKRGGK